jgi:hypothetical protein
LGCWYGHEGAVRERDACQGQTPRSRCRTRCGMRWCTSASAGLTTTPTYGMVYSVVVLRLRVHAHHKINKK